MKKIWKYLLMLVIANGSTKLVCEAQITLDTVMYGYLAIQFKAVQISETETKWFYADTTTNTFNLYNMDFSPFMTNISVPEPFAPTTSNMQALYITRSLFDCDTSNIEYAFYAPTPQAKPFRIVRTDGTLLFQLDSASGPYCLGGCLGLSDIIRPIINTSSGAKLFLHRYPLLQPIYVYSLCGTLPMDIFDFSLASQSLVKIFPNPTSSSLTFEINAPDNVNEYELTIIDTDAKELSRKKINALSYQFTVDVSNFTSGVYYYSLSTKNKAYQTGKFILTK